MCDKRTSREIFALVRKLTKSSLRKDVCVDFCSVEVVSVLNFRILKCLQVLFSVRTRNSTVMVMLDIFCVI